MTQNSNQKTQSSRSSSAVAFDLGTTQVRAVEAEISEGEARIVKRATINLPPNLWNQLEINREGLSAAIRDAITAAGITHRTASVSIPRHLVTVRFARLPHADPEQLKGMIEFEAQQYILFPLEEVMLDYKVLDSLSGGMAPGAEDLQTVLLAAARKSLVSEIIKAFDRAGVTVEKLSVSALALSENIRDAVEPTALVSVDQGAVDVIVVANRQLIFTRSSVLDVIGTAKEVGARKLSEEITRSFTAYQNEFRNKSLSRIVLCGSATTRPENDWVEGAITDTLEMPISRLQTRTIPAADPELRGYSTAAGLALQATPGNIAGINLVPNDRVVKKAAQQKQSRQALFLICALGLVGLGGWLYFQYASSQDQLQKQTVSANKELVAALKQEAEVKKAYDKSDALEAAVTTGLDREHPSVDILVALNQAMPKSSEIWLTQLGFERGGILSIRGETKESATVTSFLVNLQKSGAFREVRLFSLGDVEDKATVVSNPNPDTTKTPDAKANQAGAGIPQGSMTTLPGMAGSPQNVVLGQPPQNLMVPNNGMQLPPGMSPNIKMQPMPGNPANSKGPILSGGAAGESRVAAGTKSSPKSGNADEKKTSGSSVRGVLTRFVINCRIKKVGALIAAIDELPNTDNGPAKSVKKLIKSANGTKSDPSKDETGDENADAQ